MASRTDRLVEALPAEQPAPAAPRSIALGLTLAAVLFVVANHYLADYLRQVPLNRGYFLVDSKWSLLERLESPVETLVFGDSSGNQGVVPDLLARDLGATALNMCTIGDMLTMNDAWMLGAYLERFTPPRRVLLVHVYDIWHRQIDRNAVMRIPLSFGYWRRLRPRVEMSLGDEWKYVLQRHLPAWSQDQTLQKLFLRPFGPPLGGGWQIGADGHMAVIAANPEGVQRDAVGHLRFVKRKRFKLSTDNRAALERLAELASEHGFTIYLAPSPVYEGLGSDPAFRRYITDLNRELDAFSARHPQVVRILDAPPGFPASEMTNADHLTLAAARRYTALLTSAILRSEGGAP